MSSEQTKFIETILIDAIMEKFQDQKLIDFNIEHAKNLDGFMSALYEVNIKVADKSSERENIHNVIVKFMKGDKSFRESTKSYTQFANEIFIYSKVLPYYQEIVEQRKSSIKVNSWAPYVYFAKYGIISGLKSSDGDDNESILALENLKPKGYRCGPRLDLDRQHLLLMTKVLAEYHSMTYALRIQNDLKLEELIDEIIPLPFCKIDNNVKSEMNDNFYDILYRVALDRFILYFDKTIDMYKNDKELIENVNELRKKYYEKPTTLLEYFRQTDKTFSLILHGDFNRNNVLFQYETKDRCDNPKDIKMIDFQELRYGTPAIDLTLFMYMNMDPSIRNEFWMELLKFYNTTLLNSLADILKVDVQHESLKSYSFEKFYEHFSKFAFYGALVSMHFMPFMASTEDECSELARLFETDMYGDDFKKIFISAGGDETNKRIMDIVKHANRMGYMSHAVK